MEVAAAAIGITEATARVSVGIWKLCDIWREAPKEVHRLRDELARAHEFLGSVREKVVQDPGTSLATDESSQRLTSLLGRGRDVVEGLEDLINEVLGVQVQGYAPNYYRAARENPLKAKRKFIWMTKIGKVRNLRAALARNNAEIYGELVALNLYVGAQTPV